MLCLGKALQIAYETRNARDRSIPRSFCKDEFRTNPDLTAADVFFLKFLKIAQAQEQERADLIRTKGSLFGRRY